MRRGAASCVRFGLGSSRASQVRWSGRDTRLQESAVLIRSFQGPRMESGALPPRFKADSSASGGSVPNGEGRALADHDACPAGCGSLRPGGEGPWSRGAIAAPRVRGRWGAGGRRAPFQVPFALV